MALIRAERNLYEAKECARDGDGNDSELFRTLNMAEAMLSEQVDALAAEAEADDYPFTELLNVGFVSHIAGRCDVGICDRKSAVQNHFITSCARHVKGNRPEFYKTRNLKRRGLIERKLNGSLLNHPR
jgi:hypothetical protein